MNRPGIECHRLKPGDWLAGLYVADVSGGVCTVLCDVNAAWTREEIEAEGHRIRCQRRAAGGIRQQRRGEQLDTD